MLRVLAGERPARPLDAMDRDMPDHVWHIIQLCWKQDPKERPNITRVIEMMLAGNADLRLNVCIYHPSSVFLKLTRKTDRRIH